MPNLTNSTTTIQKATYVPLTEPGSSSVSNRAVTKASFLGSLSLQPGEVSQIRQTMAGQPSSQNQTSGQTSSLWNLLVNLENARVPSQLPALADFASVTPEELTAFGTALIALRQRVVDAEESQVSTENSVQADKILLASVPSRGLAVGLLNSAVVQANIFKQNINSSQVGMLNLERLEMTPVGIERGGLIATIPLAPKEHTFVVQKEWSVTTQEFTSIVTDSLDNYSETGVTENTQLTQATTSQVAHNNQFNVTASASGGIGFVSGSSTSSFGSQDQSSKSANTSRQNSIQTTRKASSRVKQSHKISISTTTVAGTSEATTRKLENPSATDPIRIDYFSMMRKWYVALYRYGLRLTYDLTVPEPGAAMREVYAQLDLLQQASMQQLPFSIKHSDITADTHAGDDEPYYLVLADQYGIDVPPPPSPSKKVINLSVSFSDTDNVKPASFTVPDGYWIESIIYSDAHVDESPMTTQLVVDYAGSTILTSGNLGTDLCAGGTYLWQQSGQQAITVYYYTTDDEPGGTLSFTINCVPTDNVYSQWQSTVWTALYNAAQSQFYASQQLIGGQITALQNQINNVDTLTLRREENDEIMKCVLRWLIGPSFAFMPAAVQAAFATAASNAAKTSGFTQTEELKYGVDFTGNQTGLPSGQWTTLGAQQSLISFINQAIEWENVVFFLYSYFWDDPLSWDFIRQIQHPDKTRQAFLRAGSARVVLTVRQGWELAWSYFVNTGSITLPDPLPNHPYLTIAQQIAAYDSTNYPGIPPANPNGGALIDDDTPQFGTTCAADLTASPTSPVTIPVADASGFVVGATAIIDTWNAGIDLSSGVGPGGLGIGAQETQSIMAVVLSPPSITVQALLYNHSTSNGAYPIVQAGAKGVLIGEWYEYTPSSGTDIAVTSNLSTIA